MGRGMQHRQTVDLGFTAHKYQLEFLHNWKPRNLCICTRGWGKTVLAIMKLVIEALAQPGPCSYAYIAPRKGQAKDVTRDIIPMFLAPLFEHGLIKTRDDGMELFLPRNGAVIRFYGTDSPNERYIRGKTLKGLVVDEFDDVKQQVWYEIIRPTLRTHEGWALLIGTIQPGGNLVAFRDKYEDDPEWNIATYTFSDCWEELPAYSQTEHDRILRDYSDRPNEFAREYECDEQATGEDTLIPARLVYGAFDKQINPDIYDGLPKIMAVDVSTGESDDSSVILQRQGLQCSMPKLYKVNNMVMADIVAQHVDRWQPDALFVDKGRGEGVISRLRALGYPVIGVEFGSRPFADIYFNKRTEMYFEIKRWLEMGGALPNDRLLMQELLAPLLVPQAAEKLQMERKHKIKDRLGRSPDRSDALAMTFATPVAPTLRSSARARMVNFDRDALFLPRAFRNAHVRNRDTVTNRNGGSSYGR